MSRIRFLLLTLPLAMAVGAAQAQINDASDASKTKQESLGEKRLDARVLSSRSDGIRNGANVSSKPSSPDESVLLQYPGDPYSSRDTVPVDTSSRSSSAPVPDPLSKSTVPYYSFDSREWVEYLPGRTELPPSFPSTASDPFSSNRISSLSAPDGATLTVVPRQHEPYPRSGDLVRTDLQQGEILLENIRLAATEPIGRRTEFLENTRLENTSESISKKAAPTPKIDLSPSYSKELKYVAVCGVVVVQANFPLSEIQSILTEIEGMQRDLNLYMGVPAPREKIELCLFKDESSYHRFLRARFPKAPRDRRALYIKLNEEPGTLLVQRSKDFALDLRHEMTHAIIHASIPVVPIWLDEGLAKYFEPPSDERAEKNPYLKSVRWNTRFGAVPSLRRLERLEFIGEMGSREYRDSWAWVHFMIHHSPDTHRLLAGYLQLLATLPKEADSQKTTIAVPSLSLYLNDVLGKSREQFREHFRTWGVEEE